MFGFDRVSGFVHHLESIYDHVREGKIAITKELINVTLASLDHIKNIIDDTEVEIEENKSAHQTLTATILSFFGGEYALSSSVEQNAVPIEDDEPKEETYYILFKPHVNVLKNGTNPLYLLDELHGLGVCEIFPRFEALTDLADFEVSNCYSYWEILISTTVSINGLKDVFLFVESESEIKIEKICAYNLVSATESKAFIQQLSEFEPDQLIDLSELKKLSKEEPFTSEINLAKSATLEDSSPTKSKASDKNISSIRVASDKLDALMSIVSELVTTQAGLSLYAENNINPELEIITENIEKLTRQLRDVAFGMTLIPIKTIMGRFQRLVRDVSDDLGKTVNFKIEGDETELDKNIIESLTDPLMHILRNSLDHGLEKAEVREKNGKPKVGNILFKAFYSGANVYLEIKDDGKGIDPEIIKAKAINKGIIHEDAALTENEIFDLIFYPGFSTAEEITDVSGRGVGMDVVRRNIENIRGEVEITSVVNQGTTLTIKLPLTMSIIDGLLVHIGNVSYVLPLAVVDKCYEVEYARLENNFNKVLQLDGVQIPFLNLRDEFLVTEEKPTVTQLIVVNKGERKVGITIDAIIGEYQAVLKPIGKYYQSQDYISGATILGDGTIALVLDTNKIINRFANTLELQV